MDQGDKHTKSDHYSVVVEVSPEEAVNSEKCIVFTDAIMSLLADLYGNTCKKQGCGLALKYTKRYVGTYLVVNIIFQNLKLH